MSNTTRFAALRMRDLQTGSVLKDGPAAFRSLGFGSYSDFRIPAHVGADTIQALGADGDPSGSADTVLELEFHDLDENDARELRSDPSVLRSAPEMQVKLFAPVGDPEPGSSNWGTWGIQAVGADTSPYDGRGVVVAVLDTGIDRGHEAFAGMNIVEQDFTGEGNGDQNGHGTHCAGTFFGRPVGGARIGIAPGIDKALVGKVLDKNGVGSTAGILEGIEWAWKNGAHVISMSVGMDFPGFVERLQQDGVPWKPAISMALEAYRQNLQLFDALIEYSTMPHPDRPSPLLIAATGNESSRPAFDIACAPPARAQHTVSVCAVGRKDGGLNVASFSNTGGTMSAPGVGIVSAKLGGGTIPDSGTSMATPHVAGVCALWADALKRQTGSFDRQGLAGKVLASCTHAQLVAGWSKLDVGAGLVQAPQ